jgi:hypothetical protein
MLDKHIRALLLVLIGITSLIATQRRRKKKNVNLILYIFIRIKFLYPVQTSFIEHFIKSCTEW